MGSIVRLPAVFTFRRVDALAVWFAAGRRALVQAQFEAFLRVPSRRRIAQLSEVSDEQLAVLELRLVSALRLIHRSCLQGYLLSASKMLVRSVVSISDMQAANNSGKTRTAQNETPFAACSTDTPDIETWTCSQT